MNSFKDIAYQILKEAGKPLHSVVLNTDLHQDKFISVSRIILMLHHLENTKQVRNDN